MTADERAHPSGGWGSVGAVAAILLQEGVAVTGPRGLPQQNESGGFACLSCVSAVSHLCLSCAWAKLAHPDIARLQFVDDDPVRAAAATNDGLIRSGDDLRVIAYDIARGCAAGYSAECNPLVPLSHHAKESKLPAAKAIPIRLKRSTRQIQENP